MGFFSSDPKFMQNPGAAGVGQQFKDWGQGQGLDMAARQAKGALKHFANGQYDSDPTIGAYLAPLRDAFATQQREAGRAYGLGAMRLSSETNPAQIARLQQLSNDRIGEQAGHAYAQAIPGIYGMLSNTFQSGVQNRRSAELAGMQGQLQAANSGQWVQKPGILDNLMKLGQFGGQIAGMAAGFNSPGGGTLPTFGGSGSQSFYNIANSVPRY